LLFDGHGGSFCFALLCDLRSSVVPQQRGSMLDYRATHKENLLSGSSGSIGDNASGDITRILSSREIPLRIYLLRSAAIFLKRKCENCISPWSIFRALCVLYTLWGNCPGRICPAIYVRVEKCPNPQKMKPRTGRDCSILGYTVVGFVRPAAAMEPDKRRAIPRDECRTFSPRTYSPGHFSPISLTGHFSRLNNSPGC